MKKIETLEGIRYRIRSPKNSLVLDSSPHSPGNKFEFRKKTRTPNSLVKFNFESPKRAKNYVLNKSLQAKFSNPTIQRVATNLERESSSDEKYKKDNSKQLIKLANKENSWSAFKFKLVGSVLPQDLLSFHDLNFKIINKDDLKMQISQVTHYLDQLKARYATTASSKVLAVYETVLKEVISSNEKLTYLFFGSKHYVHSRTKINLKRFLTCGLFSNFKETVEYDVRINKKITIREENFDLSFYKSLKKLNNMLKEKLQHLHVGRIQGFRSKSEMLINGLNAVINENVIKKCPVDSKGFIKSKEIPYHSKGFSILKDLGQVMSSGDYFGKPNFSPGTRFNQAWHYNKQLRLFLNDLSMNLGSQYSKIEK